MRNILVEPFDLGLALGLLKRADGEVLSEPAFDSRPDATLTAPDRLASISSLYRNFLDAGLSPEEAAYKIARKTGLRELLWGAKHLPPMPPYVPGKAPPDPGMEFSEGLERLVERPEFRSFLKTLKGGAGPAKPLLKPEEPALPSRIYQKGEPTTTLGWLLKLLLGEGGRASVYGPLPWPPVPEHIQRR